MEIITEMGHRDAFLRVPYIQILVHGFSMKQFQSLDNIEINMWFLTCMDTALSGKKKKKLSPWIGLQCDSLGHWKNGFRNTEIKTFHRYAQRKSSVRLSWKVSQ